MIKLSPELYALSAFSAAAAALETRELDFNLSRRSGVVINSIVGTLELWSDDNATLNQYAVQELDLAPGNIDVWEGSANPDAVIYDSSRPFRQLTFAMCGIAVYLPLYHLDSQLVRDWTHLPLDERPVSITNMRHHIRVVGNVQGYHGQLHIAYHIVELSLMELGILNASRR